VRVVIVDDNPLLLGALRRFLARHCELEVVSGAEEARELIARWPPDVIVADLRLGNELHAGLRVLESARDAVPNARRVLMTGAVPPPQANAIAHQIVQKPMEPREFLLALGITPDE
jgi:DNA-binding NarL/FixJ family response regulator